MATKVVWDERLITRERAANMAGTWGLKVDNRGVTPGVYLRCGQCDGNVMLLPPSGYLVDPDAIISAVVRHMAMNHNYSLSGAPSAAA